jgi:hypothetical protein
MKMDLGFSISFTPVRSLLAFSTPTHFHVVIENETTDFFLLICIDTKEIEVEYQLDGKNELLRILKTLEKLIKKRGVET